MILNFSSNPFIRNKPTPMGSLWSSSEKKRMMVYTNIASRDKLERLLKENNIPYINIFNLLLHGETGYTFRGVYNDEELAAIRRLGIWCASEEDIKQPMV
jgi:hypothetical protein